MLTEPQVATETRFVLSEMSGEAMVRRHLDELRERAIRFLINWFNIRPS